MAGAIILVVLAVVIAVVVKALFLQAFFIPSDSMEPGLVNNDRILVQKLTSWGGGQPNAVTSWCSTIPGAG